MMAVTNIGALLEYGRPGGVLRRAGGAGTHPEEKRIDVDDDAAKPESLKTQTSPVLSDPPLSIELSQAFKYAMQLSFSMLSLVLRNPTRKSSPFAESTLNPYLTVLLTILVTVSKHAEILAILERFIPWDDDLAVFFASTPKNILASQGLHIPRPTSVMIP
ncbi:hypothetical protein L210DRAFT_3762420 [Boletus edulis BED1]|uniref:Uncharacterized protein n=1 Tax=Boletus edulis BED1 TaxID=1328754 RepID=A0AAD4BP81_BOLED|nr:hypothetical protein L210DRAFT_3762420 [Boletus edulis BED1]